MGTVAPDLLEKLRTLGDRELQLVRIDALDRGDSEWVDAIDAELERRDGGCPCPPCPGKGYEGNGVNHCAECCFGTLVDVDLTCPVHGPDAAPSL